jgi:hypothetical protein
VIALVTVRYKHTWIRLIFISIYDMRTKHIGSPFCIMMIRRCIARRDGLLSLNFLEFVR